MAEKKSLSLFNPSTLVEALTSHAMKSPTRTIYTFLSDGEENEISMTLGQLDQQARILASLLSHKGLKGERVLLLFPPGLDYIRAFFACLYAGAVAVPAYPPQPERLNRTLPRILSILKDCEPRLILTDSMILSLQAILTEYAPELKNIEWFAADSLPDRPAEGWSPPLITPSTLAFLQYTSGSTGEPKGVVLTHANLIHNLLNTKQRFGMSAQTRQFSWLPPYHDMGLIGDLLTPLYAGGQVFHMSPFDFLQKPIRWLRAITKYKIDISGGPNFAYQYCVKRITEEEKRGLDLSSWKVAYCGSEPISAHTPEAFTKAFTLCGFQAKSFYPCYGLAEATLLVTGGVRGGGYRSVPRSKNFQAPWMSNSLRARLPELGEWVSCGKNLRGQRIAIVRPDTHRECPDRIIGEIWIRSPSVAKGYWKRPNQTQQTFRARIRQTREGPFLRTGDLGFTQDGELYVTGRLKDLIIIGGINHFPQDLESTAEAAHPAVRKGCSAAFSIQNGYEEKLVLTLEIDTGRIPTDEKNRIKFYEEISRNIIASIVKKHEVEVFALSLLDKSELPKTSSGKVQRQDCQQLYLDNELKFLYHYQSPPGDSNATEKETRLRKERPATEVDLKDWLVQQVALQLRVRPHHVDPTRPFFDLGLSSRQMVGISGELGDLLGARVSPMLLWKYPSAESLARYLSTPKLK
jgi:acyl-CoA synthetase (AMP-forming)/AMP-acid ligase II/acyl carrier protein